MSRLYIMDNSIKLLIVGDGPNKNNLIEMVKKLKLENNVVFTGMINPKDIYKYYQLGDVFVSASTSETQGLTYVEALANKLPLICKRDPCLDLLIAKGINGYKYSGIEDASLKIYNLINNKKQMKSMGIISKKISENYDKKSFAGKILNLYKKIILDKNN